MRWRFGSCARHSVVVGHTQATSRLIRSRSIGQGVSHRSWRISSALNGKERGFFAPPFRLSRSARPSLTDVPFSLSRRREKVFTLFFRLFLICRLLSFSFLSRAFVRATVVPRKEKGESEGEEKTHKSFHELKDVGLEVIHYEGVSVEGLRREGVSTAEGGGALVGSRGGGVPVTSARQGGFLSCLL